MTHQVITHPPIQKLTFFFDKTFFNVRGAIASRTLKESFILGALVVSIDSESRPIH